MGKETKIKFDSKISLAEMQLCGCSTSKQNYSKYEKDLAHISASELLAIAEILEIPLDYLFTYK